MREVVIEVRSSDDREVQVEVLRQTPIGSTGQWKNEDSFVSTSGKPSARRTLSVLDGEQIVVRTFGADEELVLDPVNNAVMPRSALESQPTQAEKVQMEADRNKELADLKRGDAKIEKAIGQASEQAADKVRIEAAEKAKADALKKEPLTQTQRDSKPAPSPSTSTSQGSPQSPAAARQTPPPNSPAPAGGMTKPGMTAGQSSKDIKENT